MRGEAFGSASGALNLYVARVTNGAQTREEQKIQFICDAGCSGEETPR